MRIIAVFLLSVALFCAAAADSAPAEKATASATHEQSGAKTGEGHSSGQPADHSGSSSEQAEVQSDKSQSPAAAPTADIAVPPFNSSSSNASTTTAASSTVKPPVTTPATPATTTITPNTTTTTTPNTTTSTTTTTTITTTTLKPITPNTTTTAKPPPVTTPPPPPKPAERHFDGPSFIGGAVLVLGLGAISGVLYMFYKARTDRNYRTL